MPGEHACGVAIRPCPFRGCRYHLAEPSCKRGRPSHAERDESESCALDVAEKHPNGLRLVQIARHLGIGEERARQLEASGLRKLRAARQELRHG